MFWYFQLQRLISDISANPLKLHKISCRDPQICSIRDICLLFSKKMEISPFWCEWDLISKRYSFPGLPLKLHKIFCRGPPNQRNMSSIFRKKRKISVSCRGPPKQRNMSSIFRKKRKISVFGVNGTSFLQVIQRKQRNQIVKKKKSGKKKRAKKKRQKSALPSSDSSTFYLS